MANKTLSMAHTKLPAASTDELRKVVSHLEQVITILVKQLDDLNRRLVALENP